MFDNESDDPSVINSCDSESDVLYEVIDLNNTDVCFVGEKSDNIAVSKDHSQFPLLTWEEDCVICLCRLKKPCLAIDCYRNLFLKCLVRWLQASNFCPVCRQICKSIIYNIRSPRVFCEVENNKKVLPIPSGIFIFLTKDSREVFSLPSSSSFEHLISPNYHLLSLIGDNKNIIPITPGLEHRRSIYRQNLSPTTVHVIQTPSECVRERSIVETWIKRDLEAILPGSNQITKISNEMLTILQNSKQISLISPNKIHSTQLYNKSVDHLG
ncbi:hypothetical protein MXB_2186, partial [Myxobolus squamalis]